MGHLLTAEIRADLERMLVVDAGPGMTRLEWLFTPARDAAARSVKTAIDKLTWLPAIDAHQMDVSVLPNERRRFPAQVARRSTNQGLERRKSVSSDHAGVRRPGHGRPARGGGGPVRPGRVRSESRVKSKTDEALVERATPICAISPRTCWPRATSRGRARAS
ncbi:hypothetical protein [Microbispora bryophytorum]|uniref:Uncharacterized protein n=1 Tax=Microbispora bryophytorum TaxID=1460882 RepID=A0A8H9LFT8_9ACTN|nr:hypothetical protein [Microbispora bryophytorum]MBD3137404.1 hypothetical protein [Microbispora bryophytorum]TQS06843.1 hypothetical protein FLX07_13375 [Microbispora bryophytorum]GGO08433.1 hypothetical protein GCM10011574_22940 [Microbispora bryophytorum]